MVGSHKLLHQTISPSRNKEMTSSPNESCRARQPSRMEL